MVLGGRCARLPRKGPKRWWISSWVGSAGRWGPGGAPSSPAGVPAPVAAVILGKVFSMPHVSKGGLIGVFVVLGAALLYLVIPGILAGFLGDGCVAR